MTLDVQTSRRRGGIPRLLRSLVILPQPSSAVSFAPADQRMKSCPRCWRLFRSVNTEQIYCTLACAWRAEDGHAS